MTQMKRTKTDSEVSFVNIPNDCLFLVCKYLEPADLHCSFPYVSSKLYTFLKTQRITPTEVKNTDNITCINENVLWREHFVRMIPSADSLVTELYCFHKLYCTLVETPLPSFKRAELTNIHNQFQNAKDIFSRLMDGVESEYRNTSISQMQQFISSVEQITTSMKQMMETPVRMQPDNRLLQRIHFYNITDFLRETTRIKHSSENDKFYAKVTLLSPINGKWIELELKMETYRRSKYDTKIEETDMKILFCSLTGKSKHTYDLFMRDKELMLIVKHLGFEVFGTSLEVATQLWGGVLSFVLLPLGGLYKKFDDCFILYHDETKSTLRERPPVPNYKKK